MGTFFPCCVYSRSPNGSNGDFQASFYSGRTMVADAAAAAADGAGRASGRVNRSHSGRGRQAQRRTMSLR